MTYCTYKVGHRPTHPLSSGALALWTNDVTKTEFGIYLSPSSEDWAFVVSRQRSTTKGKA
jgi:hypothetical protein